MANAHQDSRRREREAAEAAALADSIAVEDSAPYLGRSPEKQEEMDAAAEKRAARVKDMSSDEKERYIQSLRDQLAEFKEREQAAIAKYDERRKKAETGDFSGYDLDHPFSVFIQTAPELSQNWPVTVQVNEKKFVLQRGQWSRVPRYVVEQLQNMRKHSVQNIVDETGVPRQVPIIRDRFPYSAIPIE